MLRCFRVASCWSDRQWIVGAIFSNWLGCIFNFTVGVKSVWPERLITAPGRSFVLTPVR